MNPCELWRARALENGIYLAACNRTGIDNTMDCRQATSFCCDPEGSILLEERDSTSRVLLVDLPLNASGMLGSEGRRRKLSRRQPQQYHDCYLNLRPIQDLTGFLGLPQPGVLNVCCLVPAPNSDPADILIQHLKNSAPDEASLFLLTCRPFSDEACGRIRGVIQSAKQSVVTGFPEGSGHYLFSSQSGCGSPRQWRVDTGCHAGPDLPRLDIGPARVHLGPFEALTHPEATVAAAKQGCDLMMVCHETIGSEDRLPAGIRTIDGLAVAACAPDGAGIWWPPEGHQRWGEATAEVGSNCQGALDTRRIRTRRFQDSVDFSVLLNGNEHE
jgi:hypothetical protein